MSSEDIIRGWKGTSGRTGAVIDQPANPAEVLELSDLQGQDVEGGVTATLDPCCTWISITIGVSALACGSIMHGTCSGWTYGCC